MQVDTDDVVDVTEEVREAILDCLLDATTLDLSHETLSGRTGLPIDRIHDACPDESRVMDWLIQPFATALDDRLKALPIHSTPGPSEQRETLAVLVDTMMDYPKQQAMALHLLMSPVRHPLVTNGEQMLLQIANRLLGSIPSHDFGESATSGNGDREHVALERVGLVVQTLALAVVIERRPLQSEAVKNAVLDSLVAALNPGAVTGPADGPARRDRRHRFGP